MSRNIFIIVMVSILGIAIGIGGYLYSQGKRVATVTESSRVENEVQMDDIYVDKNEKVIKPAAEKSSTNLDETQIENQMNELNNIDTEEVNIDELN